MNRYRKIVARVRWASNSQRPEIAHLNRTCCENSATAEILALRNEFHAATIEQEAVTVPNSDIAA